MSAKPQLAVDNTGKTTKQEPRKAARPTAVQLSWLRRGLDQAGGKLPLFDSDGKRVGERTVKACIEQGWAAPWFANPIKPDWLVCKLTEAGRKLVETRTR
ncbi:MAG: hypothetical protein OEZ03_04950 [Alphaproteobacteria bacterium]|nr:hypothetical protein [Alphaproteobacteria bacterium]